MIEEFPLPASIYAADEYQPGGLRTARGRRYVDLCSGTGGIGGGIHPKLRTAIWDAVSSVPWNVYAYPNVWRERAESRLLRHFPLYDFAFFSGGAEAVEAALRVAHAVTGDARTLAYEGGFHGKSMGALSLHWRDASHFVHPYNVTGMEYPEVGAVFVEPTQTRNGVHIASEEFKVEINEAYETRGDTLVVVDEISTSFRTGHFRNWPGNPEIILLGKNFGQGIPVSILCVREDLVPMVKKRVSLTSGYGGNPIASVAITETIEYVRRHSVLDTIQQNGKRFGAILESATSEFDDIQIYQNGMWLGVQFTDPLIAAHHQSRLLDMGWLTSLADSQIRLSPPFDLPQDTMVDFSSDLNHVTRV